MTDHFNYNRKGFTFIREIKEKGYPFTWTFIFFTYKGKLYRAGYKDTRNNLHEFEDIEVAISVWSEKVNEWHYFITKAYVASVGEQSFNGKTMDDDTLLDYFNSCLTAVEELTSVQPLA